MMYIKPTTRPRIGISSCLLGENVRYDGSNKKNTYITEDLSGLFEFVPFCPEVAIGMGIPRPPIQLVDSNGEVHALGIDNPAVNVTLALREYAGKIKPQLDCLSGYIFKSHSPSCGITEVKVLIGNNYELIGEGIFAHEIKRMVPDLPVIDEQQLMDDALRSTFLQHVKTYSPSDNQ